MAGVGLSSQEQKHDLEVLPLSCVGSSEMLVLVFITSLSVRPSDRQSTAAAVLQVQ